MSRLLSIVFIALIALPVSAQYKTIAFESFDYAAGGLGNLSGGFGWANSWYSGGAGFDASVTFPSIDAIGGKATTSGAGGSYRIPDNSTCPELVAFGKFGADGSTMWFRFNIGRVFGGDDQYGGFSLFEQFNGEKLFIGCPYQATEWGFQSFGASTVQGTIPGTSCDGVDEIVARIDFLPGMERLRMWVNAGVPNPLAGAAVDVMINDFLWNEIRIESGAGTIGGYDFDALTIEGTCGELLGDTDVISATAGGAQNLTLNGGLANAGNLYFILGTLSGTSPGVVAGTFTIPINQDFYTDLTLFTPNTPPLLNNMNVLDANGTATATLALPPLGSGVVGLMAHHVGLVFDATGIALVSNPYPVLITP